MINAAKINNPIALMLQRFIESGDLKTAIIRGPWGVGKTYSLNTFIEGYKFQGCSNIVANSFVSLFGKQSVSQVQREIFSSAHQVGTDEAFENCLGTAAAKYKSLDAHLSKIGSLSGTRWFASKLSIIQVPWLGAIGEMIGQGNYEIVNSFLVTLDDLERKSDSVSLKDLLGLVDDLALNKKCKVIVVCNEDMLSENDQILLNAYKEKIFDLDLMFSRSPRVIAQIGLPESCEHLSVSMEILEKLGVSNIRVVKRYAFLVDQVWPDVKGCDKRIIQEVLEHIALFVWARYDSTAGIPKDKISYLSSEMSWMDSAFRDRNSAKEPWEVSWDSAASAIMFSSENYDSTLLDYLRTGIWLPGSISSSIAEKEKNLKQIEASADMRSAWKIYQESLNPDKTNFVTSLIDAIQKNLPYLSPRDADSAFRILEDLEEDAEELAKQYLAASADAVKIAALQDWPFGDFKSAIISRYVAEVRKSKKDYPTIDAVLQRISENRSWSEDDIHVLEICTDENLLHWIQSEPEDLNSKIRNGLLFFRNLASDERYGNIAEKALRVLREIGSQSEINRIRIENMFGIEVESSVIEPQSD